ncbi:MAG TPA: efflux RND transporter periplasmic adaptor subunit, partial [Gemmatimonadaceae bacterium]
LERSIRATDVPGVATAGRTDLVSAARQRLALWGISDAQISAILQSGLPRRTLTLYAPASGVVLEKNVVQGQAIQPGQMLYTVANLATVWVDAQLRETDAGSIHANATARVNVAALPGRTFAGRVTYVYPTLDPNVRTVRARIGLANSAGALRPGMYATVTLASPSTAALTVLSSAIIRTGERNLVFVDAGGGRLHPVEITAGRVAGDLTEVMSGLSPGQRVVTSAQFLLDAESNLGEVMRSMIGQGAMSSPMSAPMTEKGADMRGMPGMSTRAAQSAPSHVAPRR